ncbi:peptidoglycan DD-metalloendopeptidase family protein [Spongiibacter pelagi]|uniref:peptidoglycan DD-metalloendopeptidase family protein n=1 Tax=Spongiibacter pelagi TaxID=2760804 RepID=UPI00295BEB1F|nr:peptidoglycan DD-metalloendopeptidase family protein [Spongiibacter pelagi]
MSRFRKPFVIWCFLAVLSACSTPKPAAPIVDRYNPSEKPPSHYVVVQNDTLFSIAWRYGFDLDRLATANNLDQPYTIFPGQTLILQEASHALVAKPVIPGRPVQTATSKSASRGKNGTAVAPVLTPKVTPTVTPKVVVPKPIVIANDRSPWRWPHSGPIVRRFVAAGQAHKGIDLKGKIGEPVTASKAGVVVYSGSGLVGYGNLLIIKHSENYLSAYGHNRRLLKKEGEQVAAGETIAELGDSGTDIPKLHFEIRKNGKPIDPVTVLPRR